MTEPEKLTIFERPNVINCCDNNKTKKIKTAKCYIYNNLQLRSLNNRPTFANTLYVVRANNGRI